MNNNDIHSEDSGQSSTESPKSSVYSFGHDSFFPPSLAIRLNNPQIVPNSTVFTTDKLPLSSGLVNHGKLTESETCVVQNRSDVKRALTICKQVMVLEIAGLAVDDVRHRSTRVSAVGIRVDDGGLVDCTVGAEGVEAFIPVDVSIIYILAGEKVKKEFYSPREVSVNTVFQKNGLESGSNILLVAADFSAVHGSVRHGKDPGRLGTIDGRKILLEPFQLLVRLVLVDTAIDATEWATVDDVCLVAGRQGFTPGDLLLERRLRAIGEVGFAIDRNEMGEAVVERVPEVTNAVSFASRHTEAVLVSSKVSNHS